MECVEVGLLASIVHELHQHEMVGRRTVGRVEQHGRREANTEKRAQLDFERNHSHHDAVPSKIRFLKGSKL